MKRGFTLIELLAVIVILAIIALIATPIVLNIINDSKESATLRSADFYIDGVELSISQATLNNKNIKDGTYSVMEDGNICIGALENVTCKEIEDYKGSGYVLEVEVKGEKPNSGTITITNGSINDISLNLGNKVIVKNEKGELVFVEVPEPKSFAEDSWETIVANVQAGNLSAYKVGDRKEIQLTGFTNEEENSNGLYTIRIANTSTPEECKAEGFSQTACGFVVEFEDIITTHVMNTTDTNVGGYPASSMYAYIQNDIYNALPEELKNNIIDTTVVSGHGSTSGEENFVTEQDKVYLLSGKEVYDSASYDTSSDLTRQLDYYSNLGVTTSNYSGALKKLNGSAGPWWLRSACSYNGNIFRSVSSGGGLLDIHRATNTNGVAVAFRIG